MTEFVDAFLQPASFAIVAAGYFYCIWKIAHLRRDVDMLLRWREDALTTGRANPYTPPPAYADYLHKYNTEGR